jgi:nucleoside-diphosphate-sugar epimerase
VRNVDTVRLSDARVMVTGGTGFIGSHVVGRLCDEGSDVHVVTSNATGLYPYRLLKRRDQISLCRADVLDATAVLTAVTDIRPHVVIHLAALTRVADGWSFDDQYMLVNLLGTVNLVRALRSSPDLRRLVYVGTSEVYGRARAPFQETSEIQPASPYAISKYAAEQYCRVNALAYDLPIALARPFNVYGPAQTPDRVIPEAIVCALLGRPFKVIGGQQTRSFTFVEDIVDGLLRLASRDVDAGCLYNLDSGAEVSMADVVGLIGQKMEGLKLEFDALPARPMEIMRRFGDASKAHADLEWTARTPLDQGLDRTIRWYAEELQWADSPFMAAPPRRRV